MAYRDEDEFVNEELEEELENRKKEKKKKRFRLFDTQREGKGVSKEEANLPSNLTGFWKRYRRDFSRLLSVNIFYILGNFPLIFAILAISGLFQVPYTAPQSTYYPIVDAITSLGGGNSVMSGIYGAINDGNAWTTGTWIFLALGGLTLFTFGFVNVGTTYLIRNMIKGEPVFMWHDFWRAVKMNWKQGLVMGIFDLIILCLIPFNMVELLSMNDGGYFMGILFWATVVIGILYFFMRFYIYLQMITFDLSLLKILKNSLIFTLIGFKRNILAFLGIALLVFVNFCLIVMGGFLLPFGIAFPLVLLFSNCSYMSAYAAYFKIKEIMIDPYYREHPEEDPSRIVEEDSEEPEPEAT